MDNGSAAERRAGRSRARETRAVADHTEPVLLADITSAADATLAEHAAARDQKAFAEIYRRHGDVCFGLARRVLADRSLAEEAVQEVFVRFWDDPMRFDPARGTLRSYLLASVHGRSVDLVRAETSRRGREARDAARSAVALDDLERHVLDLTQAEAVRTALATLDAPEREAIELAYFGGHTYRDVAQLLETPEGTIKSRIRAGLHRLRAALIDAGYPQP